MYFDLDGPCTVVPCVEVNGNLPVVDTLVTFLNKNPSLEIEIGFHSDQKASADYNKDLTSVRALALADLLIARSVHSGRIKAKGYGETQPLVPESEILNMDTEEEQMNAYWKNRRIEIRIIGT